MSDELNRLRESLERHGQMPDDEVEADEYARVFKRYVELKDGTGGLTGFDIENLCDEDD